MKERLVGFLRRRSHGRRKILEFPGLNRFTYKLHIHSPLIHKDARVFITHADLLDGRLQIVVVVGVQEYIKYRHILHQLINQLPGLPLLNSQDISGICDAVLSPALLHKKLDTLVIVFCSRQLL